MRRSNTLIAVLAIAAVVANSVVSHAGQITDLSFEIKAPNQGNYLAELTPTGGGSVANSNPGMIWFPSPGAFNNLPGTFSITWDSKTGTETVNVAVPGALSSTATSNNSWSEVFQDNSLIGYAPGTISFYGGDSFKANNSGDFTVGITSGVTNATNPSFSYTSSNGGSFNTPLTVSDNTSFSIHGSFEFSNITGSPNERIKAVVDLSNFSPVHDSTQSLSSVPEPSTAISTSVGIFGILLLLALKRRTIAA